MKYQNRIVGEGVESPEQLLANPLNFRGHPLAQKKALRGVLSEIGWVQRVVVNQRTGNLIDGHLRAELALDTGESSIPVIYVDLSPDEERIALASLDPIAALAETDQTMLNELINEIAEGSVLENEDLAVFLASLTESAEAADGLFDDLNPEQTNPPKYVNCPHCGGTFDANGSGQ